MRPAAHGDQAFARRRQRRGLGDQAAVEGQGLIGAQDPGLGVVARHGQGLGPRQLDRQFDRIDARRLQCVLVHVGDMNGKGHARLGQDGAPRRALGGQDQAFAVGRRHEGAPGMS
ncbi:hypothetical protein D3C72_1719320 [compost metagenome]